MLFFGTNCSRFVGYKIQSILRSTSTRHRDDELFMTVVIVEKKKSLKKRTAECACAEGRRAILCSRTHMQLFFCPSFDYLSSTLFPSHSDPLSLSARLSLVVNEMQGERLASAHDTQSCVLLA